MIKNIRDILDGSMLDSLLDYTGDVIVFNYIKHEDISFDCYLEKFSDYLETYCIKNKEKESNLATIYCNVLFSAINLKADKNSRVEKYLEKFKTLKNDIRKASDDSFDKLLDFTRLFICFYSSQMGIIKEFDFSLSKDNFEKVITRLKKSKTYNNLIKKRQTINDINVKYNEIIFTDLLLEILYLHMLNNSQESE